MRKFLKRIASVFFVPLTQWYLRKERKYTYHGTTVSVLPGVFHPGFFSSSSFMIDHLLQQDVINKTLLELGCGSGLISVVTSQAGARVTASDISKTAVENTTRNAKRNAADIKIIHSDLFDSIEKNIFQWIVINPPYYPQTPKSEADYAWFCGDQFQYFEKLFRQLPAYVDTNTIVLMVLTKGCDLDKIFSIARTAGFSFELVAEKKVFFDEKDYLYKIHSIQLSDADP